MSLTLDPATEQRIQRVLAHGPYREPSELINHALDLLADEEDWLLQNREAISSDLKRDLRASRTRRALLPGRSSGDPRRTPNYPDGITYDPSRVQIPYE